MKTTKREDQVFVGFHRVFTWLLLAASTVASVSTGWGQSPPIPGVPTNTPLASWSFSDTTNWTSDQGALPIGFTNINWTALGEGEALVVATNVPAWLNFNVVEPGTGATNLVLDAPGSLSFWYAGCWASTNGGPGQWAALMTVGEWEPDALSGFWGLAVDPPGSNLWFLAQDGAGDSYGLSTPISWTTNYFHFIVLTYSATNVSIYLDGQLATNDPGGLSIWPGPTAVSGGIYFGSDTNGLMQANGLFNGVATFDYPLCSNDVETIFNWNYWQYMINPDNSAMGNIVSAPSSPSPVPSNYDIITGFLQPVGSVSAINSSNLWITNVVASVVGTGSNNMQLQFTIQGGYDGLPYDTFVNSMLDFSSDTNKSWAWMGQGFHGNTYVITNLPNRACFLVLGTPQDSDGDGLTDAYERLVCKTNPYNADTSGDGISDSDKILQGLNPLGSYPQWKMDSDGDGLPDAYESANASAFGLSPTTAEAPPGLPAYTKTPVQ